jgi:hypothetical protein
VGSALLGAVLAGCASGPPPPAPGHGTLAGRVALVAPAAAASGGSGGAYGDRRMRDVERVDYSRPGFAVVYVDAPDDADPAPLPGELTIVDGPVHAVLDPADLALRTGSRLVVRNAGRSAHVVSVPGLGVLASVAPGRTLEMVVDRAGPHALHLLDAPGTSARVFATSGPFARVSESGRFAIPDLPPGRYAVHVWHPRLPPVTRTVELPADTVLQVDLALGLHAPREGDD